MSRPRDKSFTVELTPAMFRGLTAAIVALEMERESWTNPGDWNRETRQESRNASAAFERIRDAYYRANPGEQ